MTGTPAAKISWLLAAAWLCCCAPLLASQADIDPEADSILQQMGEYLASADEFSFRADVSYDKFSFWDQELQFGGEATIVVARPDRLDVSYHGDYRRSRVVFNGQTLVFLDQETNLYASLETPGSIDQAVDLLFETYGTSVPTADLLYADPYTTLIESAEFGVVVGKHRVDGKDSHHLAFSGEVLDWQIWVQTGPEPLPLQLVITYKQEPGAPQYRARYSEWNLKPDLDGYSFDFVAPENAGEMEFLPVDSFTDAEEEME